MKDMTSGGPPTPWWYRNPILRRANILIYCNWFAIALHCRIHGHDWRNNVGCPCRRVTTCAYCGKLLGVTTERQCHYLPVWNTNVNKGTQP